MHKNNFQAAYQEALQHACDMVRSSDIAACCEGGGVRITQKNAGAHEIELCFLNRPLHITFPELAFSTDGKKDAISIWEQILVLHYLKNSAQATLQNSLINYRSLRKGAQYAEAFERRCNRPLLAAFGNEPDSLIASAAPLGGTPAGFADIAVRIPAFPRLDIICCLWKPDPEFGPGTTILFDAGAENFLCAEDIAVLCQQIVLQLIKNRNS